MEHSPPHDVDFFRESPKRTVDVFNSFGTFAYNTDEFIMTITMKVECLGKKEGSATETNCYGRHYSVFMKITTVVLKKSKNIF